MPSRGRALLLLLFLHAAVSFNLPAMFGRASFLTTRHAGATRQLGQRRSIATTARRARGAWVGMVASPPVRSEKAALLRTSVSHPAYDLVGEDFVSEYGASTALYRHKKSGAEVLSVQIDDENKVFGVTFRTPPEDSTGVPHILEHSVLCGSRKYPVKEPFVDLLKGSLQTFLNAFTYPDRTCYPVASQNTKDFYNLINVYLDAVLFPRAVQDPMVMQQEGWHYELEDPLEPLTYKGVVFNEMKGVYSSADSLNGRAAQQALFPDNAYGVDSGGDPAAIPNLTFDYFKGFHGKFYHPANARVYFYGDDPPLKRLELLDEYLREFDRTVDPAASAIRWQPKKTQPWKYTEAFPAGDDMKDKHMVSVNWVVNDAPLSVKDALTLGVLDDLLMGTTAATLRKALTDSGLGESVIGGGLSDELLQCTFSAGLKGVAPADVSKVEALVLATLQKCVAEGFEADAIESSVNSIEFSLREFNTGSFPRGLSFMLSAMQGWVYGRDPTESLKFEEPLRELKLELAAGKRVFEEMAQQFLVANGHRCTVEMIPDTELEGKMEEAERSKLDEIKTSMSEQDLLDVIESTKQLKEAQAAEDSPEAKATLPRLEVSDLERKIKSIPIEVTEEDGVRVVSHAVQTNGILYADVGVDLVGAVSLEDYPLLGLFSRALLETGTGSLDRVQLSRRIGSRTGGIYCSSLTGQRYEKGLVAKPDDLVSYLFLRGKAVGERAGDLLDIVYDVLTDAKLNSQQRVIEMLKETKARLEASVASSGHSFMATRMDARYSLEAYLSELTGGITYLDTVRKDLEMAQADWPRMLQRLEGIRAALLKKERFVVNLTGDDAVLKAAAPAVAGFVRRLPGGAGVADAEWGQVKLLEPKNEGFVVPTQVNYVGKGGRLYHPGEHVPGSAVVAARFLRTGYLWDNVRVMGGAYGGFCRFSPVSGAFSFLSYRDPNLDKTLDIYDGAAEFLQSMHLPSEELELSVIGAVGDMDNPMSPDQKGFTSLKRYLIGQTEDDRQRFREEVLSTTAADFKRFGERLAALNEDAFAAVVGSKAAFEAANAKLPAAAQLALSSPLAKAAGGGDFGGEETAEAQ